MNLIKNSLFAPALQFEWQVNKEYIPCRIFKNISYGKMGITNNSAVNDIFDNQLIFDKDLKTLANKCVVFNNLPKNIKIKQIIKLMNIVKDKHTYVSRINSIDFSGPKLNSIIQINPDIFKLAKELDNELVSGNIRGPLHGIPILIKDNINTGDKMFTTAGSLALKNSKAKTDSYIVRKLRESGALILGKSNLSEWANFRGQNSSSGWSGINGQTKNPYVLSRNPTSDCSEQTRN